MKKKLSIIMAVIMILTVMVSGCSTQGGNQVGSVPDGTVAILTSAKGTEYFDTFSEPWGRANDEAYSGSNCTLTLLKDWVAVDGSLGEGYFFTNGALTPREREDDDTWLIVDLNGHTIDRGLYDKEAVDMGCVFYIGLGSDDVNIKIMNGTLTGGNNKGNGGAICNDDSDPDNIELINLEIKNNKCNGDGGAICQKGVNIRVIDTKITDNYSDRAGGGIYYGSGKLSLEGYVVIKGNDGANYSDNLHIMPEKTVDCTKLSTEIPVHQICFSKNYANERFNKRIFDLGGNASKINKDIFSCDMGKKIYIDGGYLWYQD